MEYFRLPPPEMVRDKLTLIHSGASSSFQHEQSISVSDPPIPVCVLGTCWAQTIVVQSDFM